MPSAFPTAGNRETPRRTNDAAEANRLAGETSGLW